MFSKKEVAEYYNTTQLHYENWWGLKKNLSLHYGIWEDDIDSFEASLQNTNQVLLNTGKISGTDQVLDAGCGVGGAAFFVHNQINANVTALSLSEKQIAYAKKIALQKGVTNQINFHVMDFTKTSFPDESFDVVWACESVCHVEDKTDFIKECYRLLKKGGRLILSDFFVTNEDQEDKKQYIEKWKNTWGVPNYVSIQSFKKNLKKNGFNSITTQDYTKNIKRSAKRMYYASLLGALPSELYNITHPNVSRFAKTHYKCGYYQYKALQKQLWQYQVVLAVK